MKVLVTGGAGYIGSTTCSALIDAGHIPVILDSLESGREEFVKDRIFYNGDIADEKLLYRIFKEHPDISCCIHFAAMMIVEESLEKPYEYYYNNVVKSIKLYKLLEEVGCKRVILSSSAAVYDQSNDRMITEISALKPTTPYARTKRMMEMVLEDLTEVFEMKGIVFRYFNAIGADPRMRSGTYYKNPSHILDKLVNVSLGDEPVFYIKGTDWPTRDGSAVRDYIHVWDIALAHVCAVERFDNIFHDLGKNYCIINLGTGKGVTVCEFVSAFERVAGKELPKREGDPRPGDVAGAYTNYDKAEKLLGWKPLFTVEDAIRDAIRWTDEVRKEKLGF